MTHRGERKCPKCGRWTSWTECEADGTCKDCQELELVDKYSE